MKIRGVVVNENGERITGALVIASRGDKPPAFATRTDSEGGFAFEGEADAEDFTTIRAYANDLASDEVVQRDDTPGGRSLTIEVAPTVNIYGHVHDEDGRAVHGARIGTWDDKHAITDASGGYRLKGLRPGTHHLHAWRNGRQLQTTTVALQAGEDQLLNWTLPPASGRWIRLTLSDDSPLDVEVRWSLWCRHPIHMHLEGVMPASREVTIGGLPLEHCLQGAVSADGLEAVPVNFYLDAFPEPGLIEWQARLAPAPTENLAGMLVDEHNQPLPATTIRLWGVMVVDDILCKTDASGSFSCKVQLHSLDIAIREDIRCTIVDRSLVIDDRGEAWSNPRCRNEAYLPFPTEAVVLRAIPAANVRGRVQHGGAPIAGATATLHVHWQAHGGPFSSRIETTETDDDGNFTFEGLHPETGGGLFVRIVGTGVDCVSETFELNKTTAVVLKDIEAEQLATVRGRIVSANGAPAANTLMTLKDHRPELRCLVSPVAESDSQGNFVIRDVRPGTYDIGKYQDSEDERDSPTLFAHGLIVAKGQCLDLGDIRT